MVIILALVGFVSRAPNGLEITWHSDFFRKYQSEQA